jgi:hypothetical protein
MKNEEIGFLTGRPEREQVINDDDILNLRIAVETAETMEELLSVI